MPKSFQHTDWPEIRSLYRTSRAFLSENWRWLLHQQGLDTTAPAGKAMFQMMGVFAEFERAIIQERVRAGLARAKSEGKRLGRPPIVPELETASARLWASLGAQRACAR